MNSLLPPSTTEQERDLEATMARSSDLPLAISQLWNPQTCPAEVLPWLAWAFSVDTWKDSWTEQQKRAVIAASYDVHNRKGTVGAVKTAIGALGFDAKLTEWFQNGAEPYTFDVEVEITDTPLDEDQIQLARRIIDRSKNVRSHYDLKLIAKLPGSIFVASALTIGESVDVYPYQSTAIESYGRAVAQSGFAVYDSAEVYPQ